MDLTDFDYRTVPLDSTTSRIRLVSFSRRQSDGRLFCILKAFALQHAPAFAALSYVWGDKRNKVPLPCNDNGGSVQVTKNLFNALSYFAFDISSAYQRNGFQWLWADAICINQADDKERESQVQLMRQIYEGAKQTLIWLDHSDHISDRAFKFLFALKTFKYNYRAANESRPFSKMDRATQKLYQFNEDQVFSLDTFQALEKTLKNEWFTRVWAIRELAASKQPIFISAPYEMGVDDVYRQSPLLAKYNFS